LMPRSSTSTSEAPAAVVTRSGPASAGRALVAWLGGLAVALLVAPIGVWAAFSAHEPHCEDSDAFWNGDLPTGPGRVEGVILGSSQMGLDIDIYALAEASGHSWARIARHAVEQASIPRTFPRMLASSPGAPGLSHLVVEVSPLLFDTVACGRPELDGVPMRAGWWSAARHMLGPDAELAPEVAMGWLPHRWIMTSGRRRDLVDHAKRPAHALRLVADLPAVFQGFAPPARWEGEPIPDLTPERIDKRRRFLLGAPLETYIPTVSDLCLGVLERTIEGAGAGRTVLVMPPVRARMRDAIPSSLRGELRASLDGIATRARTPVVVWDATDTFADREDAAFSDFDHLSAEGAVAFTGKLAERLR
ncbi:MAG: hypothetical protein Q7U06_00675, partial [Pseudomonadota bacterium]|nr:hypothetical protein [Pseudomonadota bacterium]